MGGSEGHNVISRSNVDKYIEIPITHSLANSGNKYSCTRSTMKYNKHLAVGIMRDVFPIFRGVPTRDRGPGGISSEESPS